MDGKALVDSVKRDVIEPGFVPVISVHQVLL